GACSSTRLAYTPASYPFPTSPQQSQLDMSLQFQSIQRENAEIQRQQVQLLKRLTLPAPKPPIFEGDILEYPKWESAFEALIEEDGNPSHKLYYLVNTPMFERDFSETQFPDKPLSQYDIKFMKITTEGIHQTDDNHYEIPLPLRQEQLNLPSNRPMVEKRLSQLKNRFERNPQYKKDYIAFIDDMLEKGYAEEASEKCDKAWYIPHHGVYHPKKPGKIRVVFDCSAEYQGHSLNRHLLQGPDLTNTLIGVLCRFRQEPIVFACDIEGMFHQVRVNEDHRDLLRFL
ncbi:hypothetical protein QZH41_015732, partial [Actinostola sp. cb2023]